MSDDARSDFVLAVGGAALLPMIAALVAQVPPYPWLPLLVRNLLGIGWIGLHLMLVPWAITRHREQGIASYDLDGDRRALRSGLLLAVPIVLLGTLRAYSLQGTWTAFLGLLGGSTVGGPVVAPFDLERLALTYLLVAMTAVGMVVFSGFVVNRARDAFREVSIPTVEALRTYGMAAVGVAFITGLMLVLKQAITFPFAVAAAVGLAALILLADRKIFSGMTTTRASILAPAFATLGLHIMATGGLFSDALLFGLWWGALGFGLMVVVASIAGTSATKLAWVTPVLATAIWPSCMATASISQISSGFCLPT